MLFRRSVMRLIAAPMFTAFAIISVAVGVAVTTAIYSVVDSLFFADAGIEEPQQLVFVTSPTGGMAQRGSVSDADFLELRNSQRAFRSISASTILFPPATTTSHAETLAVEAVDGAYFTTLGVSAHIGRLLQSTDHDAAARVAVLSDELWRRRYAADPGVVGRVIRIAGEAFEVVGVAAEEFGGAFGRMRPTNVWIPLGAERAINTSTTTARAPRWLLVFGRLAPGISIAAAQTEVMTISRRLDADYPLVAKGTSVQIERRWSARSALDLDREDTGLRRFGITLVVLVALVLVVACTNLANLVLARGAARQGELAVRMAMGASRGRLIREQCVESLILAVLGGIAAYYVFLGVSAMMTRDFSIVVPPAGRLTLPIRPELNAEALVVAAVSTVLALLVFGLEPAVQLARSVDIRGALAANASGIRPRVGRQRMVIRWQVAVAAGFFIVATMFIRATMEHARHDPGVDMDRLAVATLNFEAGAWDEARIRSVVEKTLHGVRGHDAIEAVAASTGLPFGIQPSLQLTVAVPGANDTAASPSSSIAAIAATPELFRTIGVEIVRGRRFTDSDRANAAPAVIVSELAASQLFGDRDALGESLILGRSNRDGRLATIVGVARDTDVRVAYGPRRPLIYVPLSQHFDRFIAITARASGRPADALPIVREAIRRADVDLGVDVIGEGRSILGGPFEIARSSGMGALYLGAFTLLLSMVGLYGVQSHVVSHRTREIGLRMSVGASASQIKLMVMRDGYRPVVEGLILGLWGGIAGRVIVRAYMEIEVAIFDPVMLLVTPVPLVAAAFCACYLPAARASRVDPSIALRTE